LVQTEGSPKNYVNRTGICYALLCIRFAIFFHKITPQKTAGYIGVRLKN
jgi:hypothetical protein